MPHPTSLLSCTAARTELDGLRQDERRSGARGRPLGNAPPPAALPAGGSTRPGPRGRARPAPGWTFPMSGDEAAPLAAHRPFGPCGARSGRAWTGRPTHNRHASTLIAQIVRAEHRVAGLEDYGRFRQRWLAEHPEAARRIQHTTRIPRSRRFDRRRARGASRSGARARPQEPWLGRRDRRDCSDPSAARPSATRPRDRASGTLALTGPGDRWSSGPTVRAAGPRSKCTSVDTGDREFGLRSSLEPHGPFGTQSRRCGARAPLGRVRRSATPPRRQRTPSLRAQHGRRTI